ncbi:hypothetical protein Tco_0149681 [Tanacetum coccineum]
MDTAYGSSQIRRIGNWSNVFSCKVQALIRRISLAGYGVLVYFRSDLQAVVGKVSVRALNEIKASLRWRVVCEWVGDDLCGDGDLPAWSSITWFTQSD